MALELEDLLDGLREVIRRTAETGQSLSILSDIDFGEGAVHGKT